MRPMQHFARDDDGYLDWLNRNPDGFVVNTYLRPSPAYFMLHRASCRTISHLQPSAATFTEAQYSKLCGARTELEEEAQRLGGTAQPCTHCL
jgi:hypothetical protein